MTYSEVADLYNAQGVFEQGNIPFRVALTSAKSDTVNIDLLEGWYFYPDNDKKPRTQHIAIKRDILSMKNGIPTVEKKPLTGIFYRRDEDIPDIPFLNIPKKEPETPNVIFEELPKTESVWQKGQLSLF